VNRYYKTLGDRKQDRIHMVGGHHAPLFFRHGVAVLFGRLSRMDAHLGQVRIDPAQGKAGNDPENPIVVADKVQARIEPKVMIQKAVALGVHGAMGDLGQVGIAPNRGALERRIRIGCAALRDELRPANGHIALRAPPKEFGRSANGTRDQQVICAHEAHDVSVGCLQTFIHRGVLAPVLATPPAQVRIPLEDGQGRPTIRGAIVNDEVLDAGILLAPNALDELLEVLRSVVHGGDDRNQRRIRSHA
jgi:hypothetical protein